MAFTDAVIENLALFYTPADVLAQTQAGTLTPEDGQRILDLQAESGISGVLPDFLSGLTEVASTVTDNVVGGLGDVVAGALGLPFDLENKIKALLDAALSPVTDLVNAIPGRITSAVQGTIGPVVDTVTGLSQSVLSGVANIAGVVDDLARGLEDRIVQPVTGALNEINSIVRGIDDRVKMVVSEVISPVIAVSDSIFEQVQGFATALRDTIPELGETLAGGFSTAGDFIGESVKGAFQSFIDSTGLGGLKAIMDAVGRIPELLDPQGAFSPDLVEKMGVTTASEFRKEPAAMVTLMIPFINTLAQIVFAGPVENVQQASRGDANSGILAITDLTALRQRNFVTDAQVSNVGFRSGLNEEQIRQVFELTKTRLGTLDIIDYWRRELIDDAEAFTKLREIGWDNEHILLIQEAAFPPPGVQDLIRMAVREVFSPEIAAQFGQFDDIPPLYLEWAKKIGLSEEWARNYWAAHWVLPSVQQGFEMLHRNVITDEDIERLFVALDVMPFWREPLKAIAFRPFTRVDVRRMFALGVLDRDGVLRAYLDLGFDTVKAEAMTEFTVKWVESTRKVEKDRERDLTKSDIIGLFNDGLYSAETAKDALMDMGYDVDEAEVLIQREELQAMLKDRKADIALIVGQAKNKVLTFAEAQDRLNGLNLTQPEIQKALLDVTRATKEKIRLPTKGDLDSWRDLELISQVEYETELDTIGYPAKYIAFYVQENELDSAADLLAAEERDAKKSEPRPVAKGQLDSLFRSAIIDDAQYRFSLEKLRFASGAIDDFTTQITIQIEEIRLADEERLARGEQAADKERPLSRVVLGKLLLKGLIDITAYEAGLVVLGFTQESIDLLSRLIQTKIESLATAGV